MMSSIMSSKPEMVVRVFVVVSAIQLFVAEMKNKLVHEIAAMDGADLAKMYHLSEEDVPGASLCGKSPDELNVEQLKRWLAC